MTSTELTELTKQIMALPKKGVVIAIDGPAATGKSSVTRKIAERLNLVLVDTGALYRAVSLSCLRKKIVTPKMIQKGGDGAGGLSSEVLKQIEDEARSVQLEFKREPERNPANRIYLNDEDVSDYIRTPEVSMATSLISAVAGVRTALLGLQRRLGCEGSAILEGRDIGTVIFPDADLKIFLTASIEERAKRRLAEMSGAGADPTPSFEEVKEQLITRDRADSQRAFAPLKKAEDAVEIDTTQFTFDEVVQKIIQLVREKTSLKI